MGYVELEDPFAITEDLAYKFGTIPPKRVSQLFHKWTDVISRELKQLVVWPDQLVIKMLQLCLNVLSKLIPE